MLTISNLVGGNKRELVTTLIAQGDGTAIGDMTANGGLAAAFDGTTTQVWTSCATAEFVYTASVGKDWGASVTHSISQVKFWSPSNVNIDQETDDCAFAAKLYGSAAGFESSPVLLETWSSLNNTSYSELFTKTTTPGTAYRYHWVEFDNTGENNRVIIAELEFYEDI